MAAASTDCPKPHRLRTVALLALAVAVVASLIAVSVWPGPCPIELRCVDLEPSKVVDAAGAEFWLVNVEVTNRLALTVMVDKDSKEVEAKIGGRWVAAPNVFQLSGIGPGRVGEEALLMPVGADACRVRFRYYAYRAGRGWKRELADWAGRKFPSLYKNKLLGPHLIHLTYSSGGSPRPPRHPHRRSAMTREALLPRTPSRISPDHAVESAADSR